MSTVTQARFPWTTVVPLVAVAVLVPTWGRYLPVALSVVIEVALIVT
ncbi:hypothetical protein BH11ACT8_BH11ACT8_19000 [soil metagenome]